MSYKADLDEWVKVGIIGVDAGLCWVGDPCYILHQKKSPKDIGKNWGEFCGKLTENLPTPPYEKFLDTKQFNYDLGHKGLGVVVSTGYGDGTYGVYVRYSDKGKRVAEVKVVFIGDEDDSDDYNEVED